MALFTTLYESRPRVFDNSLARYPSGNVLGRRESRREIALSRVVEDLTQEVKVLREGQQQDILTAREAANYLGYGERVRAFEEDAKRYKIPKHSVSDRKPRYLRKELLEYVPSR